jgi:hypothetical protein
MATEWHFRPRTRADELQNPIDAEHFDEAVGDDRRGPARPLVREAIQNSLDAARKVGNDREQVNVRFYVSNEKSTLPASAAAFWFTSVWSHLRAKQSGLRLVDTKPGECNYVVVEDFGTRGLEGDPNRWRMPNEREQDDLFSFFRANGLSGKSDKERGSWGVGKSVFSRCSQINCFLAATVRSSDHSVLTLGKCVLKHHTIGPNEFMPFGRFGNVDTEGFVLPANDLGLAQRMAKEFRLARDLKVKTSDLESGLSVIIPYADPDITGLSLVRAVVREYFAPIITGGLTVTVTAPDVPHGTVQLNADEIDKWAAQEDPRLAPLFALLGWSRTPDRAAPVELRQHSKDDSPAWDESLFPDTEAMKAVAATYLAGEPVAVRVPVRVLPTPANDRRKNPAWSYFDVFLQRSADGEALPPCFIREGLVISEVYQRKLRGIDAYALIIIDDPPLAEMLRAAEPPAHTRWSPDTGNFRGLYGDGAKTIQFVVDAPREIAEALAGTQTQQDLLSLAEFFPDEGDSQTGDSKGRGAGKRSKKNKTTIVDPPPARKRPFRIVDIEGGFRIVRDNADSTTCPLKLEILTAYDTSRGDPLRKYHPADFNLSKLKRRLVAASEAECEGNRTVILPQGDEFSVEVTGFDAKRDVHVRVRSEDATKDHLE